MIKNPLSLAAVALLASTVLLGACGSDKTIKTTTTETTVAPAAPVSSSETTTTTTHEVK
jgi:uncharacterized lipoprotein YajG